MAYNTRRFLNNQSWDDNAMFCHICFFIILPLTRKGKDIIWVVLDRLGKADYFIPIPAIDSTSDLASFSVQEIVRLHGVL
jgi:hypothetical protein